MDARIPAVEIADDGDPAGVGRPDGEGDAGDAFDLTRMGAELLVAAVVRALGQQMDVEVAQHEREAIGVVDHPVAARIGQSEAIGKACTPRHRAGEEARRVHAPQRRDGRARPRVEHGHGVGIGLEAAHLETAVDLVHAEYGERVGMGALGDRVDCIEVQ